MHAQKLIDITGHIRRFCAASQIMSVKPVVGQIGGTVRYMATD